MTRVITLNDDQFEIIRTALKVFRARATDWRNDAEDSESFDHYADLLVGIEQTEKHLVKEAELGNQERKNGTVYLARVAQVLDKYLAYPLASQIVKEMALDHDGEE